MFLTDASPHPKDKEFAMRCKLLLGIVPVLILCNCVQSILLNKQWSPGNEQGKTLAIVLRDKSIQVDYSGDVKNEFGVGNMKTLIKANARAILYHGLIRSARFQDIWFDSLSAGCSKNVLPPANDNWLESKYAPPVNSTLELVNRQADYVLLFYGFYIKSQGGFSNRTSPDDPSYAFSEMPGSFGGYSCFNGRSMGFGPSAQYPIPIPGPVFNPNVNNYSFNPGVFSKDLGLTAKFVLWDVKQRCPVVHGFSKNNVSGYFTNYSNWKDIIDKTLSEMLEKTGMLYTLDTVNYTINQKAELQVVGTKDKIDLKTKRFTWLFAHTVTKNDIDSSDVKKIRSDSKSAEDMERSSGNEFHFRNPRTPGAELDTVGSFTKSLFADISRFVSKDRPSVAYGSAQLQAAFQNQVLDHFSKFDYPVDTLDNTSRALALADSIDYLLVYYGRFSQPKPDDEIKSLEEYDMNFYFNLIDVRTNTTLAGYYGDLGDLFDYTREKTAGKAVRVFEIISKAYIKSRVRL
jgi:hypothetical protein